jgi:hypothetical protein
MAHKGHVIQFVMNRTRQNFGVLDRVKIDEGHGSLVLWLSDAPQDHSFIVQVHSVPTNRFRQIYVDQYCGCLDCARAIKEAQKPKVQIGADVDPTRIKIRGKEA